MSYSGTELRNSFPGVAIQHRKIHTLINLHIVFYRYDYSTYIKMRQIEQIIICCCFLVYCQAKVIHKAVTDSDCQVQYIKTEVICNCQNRNLLEIPKDLPIETTILELGNNVITSFGNQQLLRYNKVKRLSLATNSISYIEEEALCGLHYLQDLDISGKFILDVLYDCGHNK